MCSHVEGSASSLLPTIQLPLAELQSMYITHKRNAYICSARDAAAGILYLHNTGVIHADISLRNVLLAPRPDDEATYIAKISDFGLR